MTSSTVAALLLAGAHAEDPSGGPVAPLVPPQLIMQKADELGLSEEQRRTVRAIIDETHAEASEKGGRVEAAGKALQTEVEKMPVNEAAALERLDALLDAERGMKHLHFKMMIGVNNALSAEQRKKLMAMMETAASRHPGDTEKRLQAKLERVKRGVEKKARAGESPQDVADLMGAFPKLMEQGRIDEAEALLGKALKMLGDVGDGTGSKPTEDEADDPSALLEPDALRKEVEEMRVVDVAWRKIAWKTCLLDAIRASRAQKKPIVVWCFIDRPVDDKRC